MLPTVNISSSRMYKSNCFWSLCSINCSSYSIIYLSHHTSPPPPSFPPFDDSVPVSHFFNWIVQLSNCIIVVAFSQYLQLPKLDYRFHKVNGVVKLKRKDTPMKGPSEFMTKERLELEA